MATTSASSSDSINQLAEVVQNMQQKLQALCTMIWMHLANPTTKTRREVQGFCSNPVAIFCFVLPAVAKPQHDDQ